MGAGWFLPLFSQMQNIIRYLIFFLICCLSPFVNPAELLWKQGIRSEIAGSPACFKDRVIVADRNGSVYCYNDNSKLLWFKDLGSAIFSSPVVDSKGNIFLTTLNGELFEYDLNGELISKYQFDVNLRSTPLLVEDQVILVSQKGKIFSVRQSDGKIMWEFLSRNECFSSPVFNSGTIYIPLKNYVLIALSMKGEKKWEYKAKGVIFSSPAIGLDGSVYFTCMDHYLYKLSADGKLKWKFKTKRWIISSPVIDSKGNIYFGSYDKMFYSVNRDGIIRWTFKGKGSFNATAVIGSAGNVFVGNSSGNIYKFSPKGKVISKYKCGDFIRRPFAIVPGKNILIFGGLDKQIYAFKIEETLSVTSQWPKYLGNHKNSGTAIN